MYLALRVIIVIIAVLTWSTSALANGGGSHGGDAAPAAHASHSGDAAPAAHGAHSAHGGDAASAAHGPHSGDAGSPAHGSQSARRSAPNKPGVLATMWHAFLFKLKNMQALDEQNERLRILNAELEVENARLSSKYTECRDGKRADQIKQQAKHEGGVEVARTIASLQTHDRALLAKPPKAVFDESLNAFNSGDYETAAKAFGFLATHPENDSFKISSTYYFAGVSFFKMQNYKSALWYFQKAFERATGEQVSYAPRAMGWIALVHAKLGDKAAEKATVRELIQKFPKSKEARRLNRHA